MIVEIKIENLDTIEPSFLLICDDVNFFEECSNWQILEKKMNSLLKKLKDEFESDYLKKLEQKQKPKLR